MLRGVDVVGQTVGHYHGMIFCTHIGLGDRSRDWNFVRDDDWLTCTLFPFLVALPDLCQFAFIS